MDYQGFSWLSASFFMQESLIKQIKGIYPYRVIKN